ncbi:prolyl-tRNA synthetase associated domain-containing protein [Rhodoplanes serenus]|uniref:prolyl-tRNA synthetase associated domain-containing protein n=1 Tax=Rhodoplanes serenus TaxID=200615 RepID=UPI000DAB9F5D|nr:prolyl-tRNA synthetase associated domain-containing protein [Rhodoplanes serenus]RAI30650.1 DNA-binding protein [Rhodoplanes serenus]
MDRVDGPPVGRLQCGASIAEPDPPNPIADTIMPATPDDLFACLDGLGIAHRTVRHPPVFTVRESTALRGEIPGGHTKNLFLKDKRDALFLVVALEDAAIDLKGLHRRLGASGRFSFGSADLLRETLGVEPGSVTPFAAINDTDARVTVVLDRPMMATSPLNYHPLVNTMTTAVAPDDLVRFLRHTGHEPRLLAVSGPAPGGSD